MPLKINQYHRNDFTTFIYVDVPVVSSCKEACYSRNISSKIWLKRVHMSVFAKTIKELMIHQFFK